jgi:hypothetical protein
MKLRRWTDFRSHEKEIVTGLFALHDAVDHALLLLAQVLDFGTDPFLEVVNTPADLNMRTEF